jgi:4-hydroxy-tetrahydrodipicolinate synthase
MERLNCRTPESQYPALLYNEQDNRKVNRFGRVSMFRGSLVPLVTPFRNGEIDDEAFRGLIEWHIESGSHGITITGTTGEPAALSNDERKHIIRLAVETSAGRIPVMAGTGSVHHADTLELTAYAEQVGADAAVVIVPYYVRPSQRGLFEHFRSVADSTRLPVMLYNIPGRGGANLEPDTAVDLIKACPNIFGIKESNKDFEHVARVFHRTRDLGRDIGIYSGIELLTFPILALGGAGMVSATGNVMPKETAELFNLCEAGRWEEAKELHYRLTPINDAMFFETNPVPAKISLGLMGRIHPELRLPLAPMSEPNNRKLREVLESYNLLPAGVTA